MPCSDGRPPREIAESRARLDFVTNALCALLGELEDRQYKGLRSILDANPDLADWWARHKLEDEARKSREKAEAAAEKKRRAALAKLTPEERRLLGVK